MRFHRTLTCGFLLLIYFIPRYLVINDLLRSLIYCFFLLIPPILSPFHRPLLLGLTANPIRLLYLNTI